MEPLAIEAAFDNVDQALTWMLVARQARASSPDEVLAQERTAVTETESALS